MAATDKDGSPARDSYLHHARNGRADAIAMLEGPVFPEVLAYLWEWYQELRRGLGEGLNGIAPLSWMALDAWQRQSRRSPEPYEIDALFSLDVVTRNPAVLEAA